MAPGQQSIGQMRSDEAGAACDQDMIAHSSISHVVCAG
jgi:hypothetical protein